MKIAVIGSGAAGLTAAYYLSKRYAVDIYDTQTVLGGHANTIIVNNTPIDTGFIVFNTENYPTFVRMLEELGVPYGNSDMSFSFTDRDGFCFGSDFPQGVFANNNWCNPNHYLFLWGIHQFNKYCLMDYETKRLDNLTLGEYLTYRNVSNTVISRYVLPMTAAIWSVSHQEALQFPMVSFVRFWKNHDLLRIGGGLQWKTITGGSRQYVDAIAKHMSGIYLNTPIIRVTKDTTHATIQRPDGPQQYDAIVIATHADQAYKLLSEPTPLEQALLTAWQYSKNSTFLHTDPSVMPPHKAAWCSWNVRRHQTDETTPVSITYWMNRLQPTINQPDSPNYFVSLNPKTPPEPSSILMHTVYTHPIMTQSAMDTQSRLSELNQNSRIVFCGSYFGYGFHEDAVASGYKAAIAVEHYLG